MSTPNETLPPLEAEAPGTSPDGTFIAPAAPAPATSDQVFTISPQLYNYGVVAILFLIVGLVLGALLFGGGSGVSEAQLRIAVREELAQQLGALELSAGPVDLMVDDDPFMGPENAPVTIVEFSDFLCSFCGRHYEQTLWPLLEEYGDLVRYVYRDYPGVGGQYAVTSAIAAECADDQGKFWDFHNRLFDSQTSLASADLENILIGYAGELGMDVPTFTTCLQNRTYQDEVLLDYTDGESRGITGTPGFFINGQFMSGAQPIDRFRVLINRELERQGIEPPSRS